VREMLQKAVEYFEDQLELVRHYAEGYPDKDNYTAIADIYATALSALRDALKREEGCECCRSMKPLWEKEGPIQRMNSYMAIGGNQLEVDMWDAGNTGCIVEINYCPMCGRPLAKGGQE